MGTFTQVNKVKIRKDGSFTATGTEVTVRTLPGKLAQPGKYTVNIAQRLDQIVNKEILFSHLVRRLTPIEATEVLSSSTDGINIFWNKKFFSTLNEDEQCGVLLHEVLHNAYLHLWRREKRDHEIWNIACDLAINLIVTRTFSLPPGSLLDTQYVDMSAEEIYERLPKKKIKQQGWCSKESWEGQGQGKGSGQQTNQQTQGQTEEEKARAKAAQYSESQKAQEWSRTFDQAFTKNYGRCPEYIKRTIGQKYYIPVIDWANLVSQILSESFTDYTFSMPDRRFLDEPYILPDLYSWDNVKDVVFAFDTSGSISQDDLNAYRQETLSIMDQFTSLTGWMAICDAALHAFEEITPDTARDRIRFLGGGGTDFRPVFKKVEKESLRPKAMFYFTDTYGYYPEDPGYPVFWLVHSRIGDTSQYNVPFGKVVKFMNRSEI